MFSLKFEGSISVTECDKKIMREGIKVAGKILKGEARNLLKVKSSKPTHKGLPRMRTGALRKAVQFKSGRTRKEKDLYGVVRFDSIYIGKKKDNNKKYWYVAPLMYGSKQRKTKQGYNRGRIVKRPSPMNIASKKHENQTVDILQQYFLRAINAT